jgi:threonine dehydrogenase-like Zn-dependent dehydrogenase
MKTAVLTRDGFKVRERSVPSYGAGEVLVRTIACGICAGDVFDYQGTAGAGFRERVLGHEGTGIVVAAGRNVQGFAEGDVVTALGGPFAEVFVERPQNLIKLPENVDPIFALGEPVACCVHAGNRFGIQPGDRAALVGCGFMGLVCLQLAKIQGAGHICAIDPVAYRREMALQLGADQALGPEDCSTEDPWQGGYDVVIEAAGAQSALDLCGDLVKQHGRVILIGYHQSNDGLRTVNMKQWNFKAIDVVNGHVRRRGEKLEAMRLGMDLMSQGHLVTEPLVTCYDLPEVEGAFRDLVAGKEGVFKAVLVTPGWSEYAGRDP